jgi:tetratricopeptide (TPR) repeat protein
MLRSREFPPARRNLAWEELGGLGDTAWRAGQPALALDLLREAIERLESGGAVSTARLFRVKLAAVLRQFGRLEEAFAALPTEDGISPVGRRLLLAERARLHLAAARPAEAAADCRELLALWNAEPNAADAEKAEAETLLAEVSLDAGDYLAAETIAGRAGAALEPWEHPDAAACTITQALARWQAAREGTPAGVDNCLRLIANAPLLGAVEKARRLEAEAARLDRYGRSEEARILRDAAQAQCSTRSESERSTATAAGTVG